MMFCCPFKDAKHVCCEFKESYRRHDLICCESKKPCVYVYPVRKNKPIVCLVILICKSRAREASVKGS